MSGYAVFENNTVFLFDPHLVILRVGVTFYRWIDASRRQALELA